VHNSRYSKLHFAVLKCGEQARQLAAKDRLITKLTGMLVVAKQELALSTEITEVRSAM
jgi:hypothetical protein